MGFFRQEYWGELPFCPPGNLPDPRIETVTPAWQAESLPQSHLGSQKTITLFVHSTILKLKNKCEKNNLKVFLSNAQWI